MQRIALNARFYSHQPAGVQRYGIEMAGRLGDLLEPIRPSRPLKGMKGHLWEQVYLPAACRGRFLWSPANSGPIAVSRQVCTLHDIVPIEYPEWFSPRYAAWYQFLLPRLVKRSRHIIAVSQFVKDRIVERLGARPDKISVVWNGLDAKFRPRPAEEVEQVKAMLGIRAPRYVLSVGSLEPRKNLARLLKAWSRIVREVPEDIELVLVGGKGDSSVFRDAGLSETPERVREAGYLDQDRLPALYSGALALLYPSLYEGFGLPPIEAMACGTAALTSNVTAPPEVVGDAALLVDPLDDDDIADGIRRIVNDDALRAVLIRRSAARIAGMTWDNAAAKTRQVLLERCRDD
jgi:glycosyltransferase involved in cell wall biosynthesis